MKRIWAVLLAVALLACLAGCGKEEADKSGAEKATAKSAKAAAKGPFTFAGVGWDTPIGDCEAALEKGTGVQFTCLTGLEELDPGDPDYYNHVHYWDGAAFAADPGHYTMLGMTIDVPDILNTWGPGIFAYYTQPDDGSERKLDMIRIHSNYYALPADPDTGRPDWSHLETAEEIFRRVDKRYGDNTCVYLGGCGADGVYTPYYTVPEKELPWLFRDAAAFAEEMGWIYLCIGLVQDNVDFYIIVNFYTDDDADWNYTMYLNYFASSFAESEFGLELAEEGVPFPWVNGEPEYVEIDP